MLWYIVQLTRPVEISSANATQMVGLGPTICPPTACKDSQSSHFAVLKPAAVLLPCRSGICRGTGQWLARCKACCRHSSPHTVCFSQPKACMKAAASPAARTSRDTLLLASRDASPHGIAHLRASSCRQPCFLVRRVSVRQVTTQHLCRPQAGFAGRRVTGASPAELQQQHTLTVCENSTAVQSKTRRPDVISLQH